MPLKILVVARGYPSHDMPDRGIFVADQAAALAASGARVAVLCPEPVYVQWLDGPARAARLASMGRWAAAIASELAFAAPANRGALGVPVLRIPALKPAGSQATRSPVDLAALEAAVLVPVARALHAVWPFDVLSAQIGPPDGFAADEVATALGLPLLTTEHASSTPDLLSDPQTANAYRRLLGPGRGLVAVGRELASRLEDRLDLEPGRIPVVPNVVSLGPFPDGERSRRDPYELLWVGARKESKGTDTLLAAVALARAERPAIHLRMIGRAPSQAEDDRLRALAAELGIADVVAFEPATDRAGVAAAMARAALFVHPSPWETFGIVAAEALAMGLPVVATPSGGVEEILGSDGRLGTIADGHRPQDLAAAISATLDRLTEFDRVALRASVVDRFAPEIVARQLLGQFEAIGASGALDPGEAGNTASADVAARTGSTGDVSALVTISPLSGPVVVVAFRRSSALGRITGATVPATLGERLTVVTTAPINPSTGQPTGEAAASPGVASWIDVDIGRAFRERLEALGPVPAKSFLKWRTLRHPMRARARRRAWADRAAMLAEARRSAVGDAVTKARQANPSVRPMLLPLDADDLDPIEPFLTDGLADLAPGTLGWLVDRWETPGIPAPPAGPTASEPLASTGTPGP